MESKYSYKNKYLKYKNKYQNLKINQLGGMTGKEHFDKAMYEISNFHGGRLDSRDLIKEVYDDLRIAVEKEYFEAAKILGRLFSNNDMYAKQSLNKNRKMKFFNDKKENTEVDISQAIRWFNIAAENGDIDSMYALGTLHTNTGNIEEAIKWYTIAITAGDVDSMMALGNFYKDTNKEESIKFYTMAAERGNHEARQILKVLSPKLKKRLPSEPQELEQLAVDKKDVEAMVQLGLMYEKGEHVEKNISKAFKFFSDAASSGNIKSMVQLGLMYEKGINFANGIELPFEWFSRVVEDQRTNGENHMSKAIEFYEIALKTSNATAAYRLGRLFEVGVFLPQNFDEAIKNYEIAKKQSGPDAINAARTIESIIRAKRYVKYDLEKYIFDRILEYNLIKYVYKQPLLDKCIKYCIIKLYDKDVSEDLTEIYKFIRRCAHEEEALGYVALGVMCIKGVEEKIDNEQAFLLFRNAAQKRNVIGQIALGMMYMNGIEIKKDQKQAVQLFKLSAEQMNVRGQALLGMISMDSILVENYQVSYDLIKDAIITTIE
jgi:TPR repeat protein